MKRKTTDRAKGLGLLKPGDWKPHRQGQRAEFLLHNLGIALEGNAGPEGLRSREGTDSLCWVCVDVLRSQASSGVGVPSSAASSPAQHSVFPSSLMVPNRYKGILQRQMDKCSVTLAMNMNV